METSLDSYAAYGKLNVYLEWWNATDMKMPVVEMRPCTEQDFGMQNKIIEEHHQTNDQIFFDIAPEKRESLKRILPAM